jgi:hypothetical protein
MKVQKLKVDEALAESILGTKIVSLLENVAAGTTSVKQAVYILLNEIGRGDRILVIDENLLDLEKELAALRYTVRMVPRGMDDEDIKRTLRSRILITCNGVDFADDTEKYYYGLIWVRKPTDAKILAKKVEAVLMRANFAHNLTQVVSI